MLDKLTLHAQLTSLAKNSEVIEKTIAERNQQQQQLMQTLQQVNAELERLRGARDYHNLLVQQTQQAIAAVDAEEAAKEKAAKATT